MSVEEFNTEIQASRKIALVIDSLAGGGAERVVIELAQVFADIGHTPVIISLQARQEYTAPTSTPVHFLYSDIRVKLYKKSDREKHADNFEALLKSIEGEYGQFDLILSNLDETHYILSACELPNVKYVVHNAVRQTLKRALKMGPVKYFRQRRLFKSLHDKNLVAVSKGLAKELELLHFIKPASVKQIYNPFNRELIAASAQESIPNAISQPYIIHVGRFAKQKRHDILFAALKCLPFSLKLVCLGTNKKGILKLANQLNLMERIICPGFQQNPYSWIANAKCLVLSSDYEGFGNVLIEALACGTPVVSTDCDFGPNEILIGELKPYLVSPNNPEALAAAINKAISGEYPNIDERIFNPFSARKIAAQYLNLISTNNQSRDIG